MTRNRENNRNRDRSSQSALMSVSRQDRSSPAVFMVEEGPQDHVQAVERTRQLIDDPAVPAVFEAAFAFDNVLIRVGLLERLLSRRWRLSEVKSTTRVTPEHLDDLAIQAYVIGGSGLAVANGRIRWPRSPRRRWLPGIDASAAVDHP